MKKTQGFVIPLIIAIVAILALGGAYIYNVRVAKPFNDYYFPNQKINNSTTTPIVGNDKDMHGCIGSAGYTWCELKNKCLRVWEEKCEITSTTTKPVACTMDAKQCPDGSYVGRTGPKCEFVCPVITSASGDIKKVYKNGDKYYLDIDYVESLSGLPAVKAIIEDTACPYDSTETKASLLAQLDQYSGADIYGDVFRKSKFSDCVPPNGIYYRNNSSLFRSFEIDQGAVISVLQNVQPDGLRIQGYTNGVLINLNSFFKTFNYSVNNSNYSFGPFLIKIDNHNKIIEITEIFVP